MRRSRRAAVVSLVIALIGAAAMPGSVAAQGAPVPTVPGAGDTTPPAPEVPDGAVPPPPTVPPVPTNPTQAPEPGAQEAPEPVELREMPEPEGPVPDPTPRVRALMAEISAIDTVGRLAAEQAAADAAVDALGLVAAEAEVARTGVVHAKGELDRATDLRAELAVEAFIRGGGAVSPAEVELGTYELRRTQVLADTVVEHQKDVIGQRGAVVAAAEAHLRERERAVIDAAAAVGRHIAAVQVATDAVAAAQAELPAARSSDWPRTFDPASPGAWELTIMGESLFSPDDLAAFAAVRAVHSRASAPVADIGRAFVEEGHDEQMRGDVAFAQAALETGWFTNQDTAQFNNYAGIGHCDTCPTGWSFGSARDGVRAQVQLLKSYVEVRPTYHHPLVDGRLWGPAGCCSTWNGLTGVWATTQIYGPLVLGIYQEMLEWLLARRLSGTP